MNRNLEHGVSVLIPDGEHDTSFKVLTCLAQVPKTRIHVISDKQHTRTRYSRFCSSYSMREGNTEEEWFNQIRDLVKRENVEVMLPVSEPGTRFASAWRERLSEFVALPLLPELEPFDIAGDKGSLARFLYERDLPCPRTVAAPRALEDPGITFPVLLKPRRSYGGQGIKHCPDRKALGDFLVANRDILDQYIVQELITGTDVGCNALCKDGEILAHIIHQPVGPRERFGLSLNLRLIHCAQTLQTTRDLISAFNWSGVANIDLRFNERTNRPEILEFNPRFWGVLIGSLQGGINFPHLCCLSALKLPLPECRYETLEYMEVRHAVKRIAGRLKGQREPIPNLMRQTNLPFILRDPIPFLNRSIQRAQPPLSHRQRPA